MEVNSWISGLPEGGGALPWIVIIAVAALAASPVGRKLFSIAGNAAEKLARNALLAVLTVALFALVTTAAISILISFPEPVVHDEFCYVLSGQTFAHGRLTNPTHPLWEYFETIYVISHPTYQSKYPPGQGMALAVGIVLANEPIIGVWVSAALACAAITWMLLAWVPRQWAVAGGFITALHPLMLQWSGTFWGGAVALAGGALVLGAMRRIWDKPKIADAIVLGIGALILANSRPFEGLVLCVPVALTLLLWLVRRWRSGDAAVLMKRLVLPCLLVLLAGGAWMAYYNFRVTGHPLLMPYVLHDRIYGGTPVFVWQAALPQKAYNNPQLERHYTQWEAGHWEHQQTFAGWAKEVARKCYRLTKGFFQPLALLLALVALPAILRRDRWMQLAAAMLVLFVIGNWGITRNILMHYAAPAGPLAIVLLVACMALLVERGGWQRIAAQIVLGLLLLSVWPTCRYINEMQSTGTQSTRANIVNSVLAKYRTQNHLFVVRYLPDYNPNVEWVYNGADIDRQQIVWARDLGQDKLPRLLNYYKDRRSWLIEIGPKEVKLFPLGWELPK